MLQEDKWQRKLERIKIKGEVERNTIVEEQRHRDLQSQETAAATPKQTYKNEVDYTLQCHWSHWKSLKFSKVVCRLLTANSAFFRGKSSQQRWFIWRLLLAWFNCMQCPQFWQQSFSLPILINYVGYVCTHNFFLK